MIRRPTLALVLLLAGLGARSVLAQTSHFVEARRTEDPLRHPLATWWEVSGIAMEDIDEDGDLDVIMGGRGSRSIDIIEQTERGFERPRVLVPGRGFTFPTFIDVDGDGHRDVVERRTFFADGTYGRREEGVAFDWRPAPQNPFAGMFAGVGSARGVDAGDIDGDGLDDLVVGMSTSNASGSQTLGRLALVRQTAPGTFVHSTGGDDPFAAITFPVGFLPNPALGDADGDGDLDVVVSCTNYGYAAGAPHRYYEQTAPGVFVERTGAQNPFAGLQEMSMADLELLDFDGDSDLDVVQSGEPLGGTRPIVYFEGTPTGLVRSTDPYAMFGGFPFSADLPLSFGDVDGDGDDDLVATLGNGLAYYRRTASGTEPFERLLTQLNPFHWVTSGNSSYVHPALADLDTDGDMDLVVSASGLLRYIEHVDVNLFVEQTGAANPLAAVRDVRYPVFGDMDGDGDLDLVTGDSRWRQDSLFRYFEQTAPMAFTERTGSANPLGELNSFDCINDQPSNLRGPARPLLVDLDHDGDLDLVSGRCFFQHIGDTFVPVLVQAANPLLEIQHVNPSDGSVRFSSYIGAFHDFNADGYPDALVWVDLSDPKGYRTYFNTGLMVAAEPVPTGTPETYRLGVPTPNPAAGTVRLTLAVAQAQPVRAALYDALGRRVALLHDGPVAVGVPLQLDADVSGLPAGVYVVRAEGETFSAAQRLTVAH